MRKKRSILDKKRKEVKDVVTLIEKLPEEKKREILGIITGYALCMESEKEKVKIK